MTVPEINSLSLRLKRATASQHELLEEQLQLLRPEMSLQQYRELLERFFGFYVPWERKARLTLEEVLPGFFDQRSKVPLLRRDLEFLGSDLDAVPEIDAAPPAECLASVLGSLYVLEGATLGGQILARHFSLKFGLSAERGCTFFSSYGADVGRHWRGFCEILDSYSSTEAEPLVVESAVRTFACLGEWLTGVHS